MLQKIKRFCNSTPIRLSSLLVLASLTLSSTYAGAIPANVATGQTELLMTSNSLRALVPEAAAMQKWQLSGPKLPSSNVTNLTQNNLVALYTDRGSWNLGVEHLKLFMTQYKFPFEEIKKEDILSGKLRTNRYSTLIMPGGASWEYLEDLGDAGAQEILNFVARGNSYLGICAGAFYATSERQGGAATGHYGIGLLNGTAYDGTALHTPPFKEGMLDFNFALKEFKSQYKIVLLGGPSFHVADAERQATHMQVWSRFTEIDEPAMVEFEYHQGKVFLSAPHFEIEENLLDWGSDYVDPESDWPILAHALNTIRNATDK